MTTGEFLPQLDVADYKMWLHELPDGTAALVDPFNDEPIDPNCPPGLLQQDERMARGYAYLQGRPAPLRATVLYGSHGEYAHLDETGGPAFEERVSKADAYFYEYMGWNASSLAQAMEVVRGGGELQPAHMHRVLTAASDRTVLAMPADVEAIDRPLEQTLAQIHAQKAVAVADPDILSRWWPVWTNLREWYMVGRIGYELSVRDTQGWPKVFELIVPTPSHDDILLTLGSAHRDVTRKLSAMQVTVEEVLLDSNQELPPSYIVMANTMQQGVIPSPQDIFTTR